MQIFPSLLPSFQEWLTNPNLFLKDRNVAFVACISEVVDMLKSLFCQCHRTLPFFSRFDVDEEVSNEENKFTKAFDPPVKATRDPDSDAKAMKDKLEGNYEMIYGMFINFFQYFCQIGGVESMLKMITESKNGTKLPLEWIATLLGSIKQIK